MFLMAVLQSFRSKYSVSGEKIEKILLIQFGGIGDMVLITPAIRALINSYPHSTISVLGSSEYNCRFLKEYNNISEINGFNIFSFDMRQVLKPHVLQSLIDVVRHLRKTRYDLLISFRYLPLIDWLFFEWLLIFLCKTKYRIGLNPPFLHERSIFDQWLLNTDLTGKHYTDFYCDLLTHSGIHISSRQTEFPVSTTDMRVAGQFLSSLPADAFLVSVHVGGVRLNLENEVWDIENYISIVEGLIKINAYIVILGSSDDREKTRLIAQAAENRCIDLTAKTSIEEMAAVVKKSHLFIGNDSGPFHVAVAVGTPTIGIFTRNVDEPEYYLYKNDNVFIFRESFTLRPSVEEVLKKAENFFLKRRIGDEARMLP